MAGRPDNSDPSFIANSGIEDFIGAKGKTISKDMLHAFVSCHHIRFDLFPHLSKCSLEVFNTFKRMLGGISGVGTLGTMSFLRAVCIPLSALCSVMRVLDAGRMHSAKLTKLLSANCLIARWAFKPDLASSAPNSEQQRAG